MESGGKDVLILKKKEALQKINPKHLWLVQEFIDSSRGIPGFSRGFHDLRLVFVNEKLLYALMREPAKGKLLANLAQGGSLAIVPLDKIPKSVYPIIKQANQILETFNPRIYSIDLMFDEKKHPWVVELNSMPGLFFTPEEKPYMTKMYLEMLKVFKKKLEVS